MREMTPMPNHTNRRTGRAGVARLLAPALLALPLACMGGDSLTNPPTNDGKGSIPWSLNLNHGAINMAIGEEVQVTVSPTDADGRPMTGLPPVVYTVSDTMVKVDATGRVTASAERSSVLLVARMHDVAGNWTIADSARIRVVAAPYSFSGFRMVPNGPELVPANQVRLFDAFVTDAAGRAVLDAKGDTIRPLTYYSVSTKRSEYYVSNNWSGQGFARNLSEPKVTGTSYIFGNVYRDSVKFRVTYPDSAVLNIYRVSFSLTPSPSMMTQTDVTVLQGGKVMFRTMNPTQQDDIVFDDLASVIDGNIPVVPATPGKAVIFPKVGSFTYKSSRGFRGTVTVVPRP